MAHLYNLTKRRKESKKQKRFYTNIDMAVIKHDDAVNNSKIKRGELALNGNNHYVSVCGCGLEGCFIYGSFASVSGNKP